jgi:hypothetical protein
MKEYVCIRLREKSCGDQVISIVYVNIGIGEFSSLPFSSIFSKAERALLVLTFPSISLTLVAVLKEHQPTNITNGTIECRME